MAIWAASDWLEMFHLAIPLSEKIIRPVIVYFFLVIGLRVFGKRELAQLNPFDLVVLLSLSNTVQNAIIGEDNSVTGGLIGAFSLLSVNYLTVRFLFGHRRLDQLLEGESTVLIAHGKLLPKALARELVTESELLAVLHRQGFGSLEEVERCTLEPGGSFAIEGKNPRLGERNHSEILAKLDRLTAEIHDLKALLARDSKGPGSSQTP
ncbi:DUF421 domain-containing protein [Singulisphaera rosea]